MSSIASARIGPPSDIGEGGTGLGLGELLGDDFDLADVDGARLLDTLA